MPSDHAVRIPAQQGAEIVDALIRGYARRAGALAAATRAYRNTGHALDAVEEARRGLIETEDTLDALGWELGPRAREVELAGPPAEIREVLYAALLAGAEKAWNACRDYEHARIGRGILATRIADLAALHRLFDAFETADSSDPE
jgi:hypothetical protein